MNDVFSTMLLSVMAWNPHYIYKLYDNTGIDFPVDF